jgi:hypothetical protein
MRTEIIGFFRTVTTYKMTQYPTPENDTISSPRRWQYPTPEDDTISSPRRWHKFNPRRQHNIQPQKTSEYPTPEDDPFHISQFVFELHSRCWGITSSGQTVWSGGPYPTIHSNQQHRMWLCGQITASWSGCGSWTLPNMPQTFEARVICSHSRIMSWNVHCNWHLHC